MIKIDDKIYDQNLGYPQLLSVFAYDKQLSHGVLKNLLLNEEKKNKKIKVKSLIPPSDFFDDIHLREGINRIEFRIKGNFNKYYTLKT